jgi:hypothetical protein
MCGGFLTLSAGIEETLVLRFPKRRAPARGASACSARADGLVVFFNNL